MKDKKNVCEECGGDGYIEIHGDGEHFEWDVIDTKPCSECSESPYPQLTANEMGL